MDTALEPFENDLRRATTWSMVVAAGAVIAGFFVLTAPLTGALAAAIVFGVGSVVAGAFELGWAWRTRLAGGAFWRFLVAGAYLVIGAYVLMNPAAGMVALALWLGVMVLARGVAQLGLAYELKRTHVWGWFVLDGLVSVVLGGFILAAWPARSVMYLGIWVGVSLVLNGAQRFMVASALRHELPPTHHQAPPLTAARG